MIRKKYNIHGIKILINNLVYVYIIPLSIDTLKYWVQWRNINTKCNDLSFSLFYVFNKYFIRMLENKYY